jgi:IS30 family transposase
MSYCRLTREERYQIEALLKSGIGIRQIARQLGRSASTVCREIRVEGGYQADLREKRAEALRRLPHPELRRVRGVVENYVQQKIFDDWSPEQIVGRLEMTHKIRVSYQSVYRYLKKDRANKGKLWKHLRVLRKQRKDKMPRVKPTRLLDRTMIENRPKEVELRKRLGDYERDTVMGKRDGPMLLTAVDRTSRLLKLAIIEKKCSNLIHKATVQILRNEPLHTITNDNGTEFSRHKETAIALKAKIYFSNAFRSWERGTNENTNGLLRQYFPKKKPIARLKRSEILKIENKLNSRPRKCLGFKTPLEVHRLKSLVLR